MKGDDFNLIQMEIDRQSVDLAPSQLAHQLESIALASRNLESSLTRERTYSRQLREYTNGLIAHLHALQKQEKEQAERLRELQFAANRGEKQLAEMAPQLEKARTELERYRHAWAQVLAREKHAQSLLSQAEISEKKIENLESQLIALERKYQAEREAREKSEQHIATHRTELQNTLVRLHSSEARYNDMARELETVHVLRKNHALELSRAEEAAREKAENVFARQRQQLQVELEQERARFEELAENSEHASQALKKDLEAKFREELHKLHAEWEAHVHAEKARWEATAREEISQRDSQHAKMIQSLTEDAKRLRVDLKSARDEVAAVEQLSRQSQLEVIRLKEDASALRRTALDEAKRAALLEQTIERLKEENRIARSILQETCEVSLIQSEPVPDFEGTAPSSRLNC